jgi:hypothetical protein
MFGMDQNAPANSSPASDTVPQNAETFRNVPNDSEGFGKIPNHSESFRTVPHASEPFGTFRNSAERKEGHTITVREGARLFEAAGVARTERSIVNWCQPNRTGIARLDAYYDPNDRRYYITRHSIDQVIREELDKGKGEPTQIPAEPVKNLRNASDRPTPERQGPREPDGEDLKTLRQEKMDLQIMNKGKDYLIEQLKGERDQFIKQLMDFSHKVGNLETRLKQLEAPKDDRVREGETGESAQAETTAA